MESLVPGLDSTSNTDLSEPHLCLLCVRVWDADGEAAYSVLPQALGTIPTSSTAIVPAHPRRVCPSCGVAMRVISRRSAALIATAQERTWQERIRQMHAVGEPGSSATAAATVTASVNHPGAVRASSESDEEGVDSGAESTALNSSLLPLLVAALNESSGFGADGDADGPNAFMTALQNSIQQGDEGSRPTSKASLDALPRLHLTDLSQLPQSTVLRVFHQGGRGDMAVRVPHPGVVELVAIPAAFSPSQSVDGSGGGSVSGSGSGSGGSGSLHRMPLVCGDPITGVAAPTPFANHTSVKRAAVILDRGVITFASKALGAQAGGALAVIVCQSEAGDWPLQMIDAGDEVGKAAAAGNALKIPILLVSHKDGLLLKGVAAATTTHCEVEVSQQATADTCPICVDRYELGCTLLTLPCQHLFHAECALPWLDKRNTCPLCRLELPVDESRLGEHAVFAREAARTAALAHERESLAESWYA